MRGIFTFPEIFLYRDLSIQVSNPESGFFGFFIQQKTKEMILLNGLNAWEVVLHATGL